MRTLLSLFIFTALCVNFVTLSSAQTPATTVPPSLTTNISAPSTAPANASDGGDTNLLPNPSFEEPASTLVDEKSLPGWELKFRGSPKDPPLTPDEAALIDDPLQAHTGHHYLRLHLKNRQVALWGPMRPQGYEAGLYEISAWARRVQGVHAMEGSMGITAMSAISNLLMLTDRWQKVGGTFYCKGISPGFPWADQEAFYLIAKGDVDVDDVNVVRLTSGLAGAFGDHMVLQRDRPVPIWGWAKDAGQSITVKFNGQSATTTSDKDGRWRVTLPAMPAGGPYVLELNGRPAAQDVMVGDVWICSGQSNMEFGIDFVHGYFNHAPEVLAQADCPKIRLWQASKQWSVTPMHDYVLHQGDVNMPFQALWNVCTPETVNRGVWGGFSAMGYFFGREIQEDQKVAVGLMMITNGGTQIESFTSAEGLQSIPQDQWKVQPIPSSDLTRLDSLPKLPPDIEAPTPAYAEAILRYTTPASAQVGLDPNKDFQHPNAVFNGMLAPVFPFAVRGVIWFQGEHNGGDIHYENKLKAMIADWRTRFGQKNLPFIIGQLCNLNAQLGFHVVRDAQLKVAQTEPNTSLAVTIDLANKPGDGNGALEIHFNDKKDVGHRMALAARALVYGEKLVSSGPLYHDFKAEGDKIRIAFDSVGGGLVEKDGKLVGFQIAGSDHKFVNADAVIDGDTVIVSAANISQPAAVRYAFASFVDPLCNLYNKEELPASPFRTDDWPLEGAK